MHKYTFFSGKGGVGKTTLAAATAVRTAEAGKRTLIVSTDPASNLADVFERPIGNRVTEIAPNLFALEIDPDSATREYGERALAPLRAVLPPDAMKVLEEQFRSACTVEIASFDRFTDFLGDTEFDHVVFDTAPTGHTLRLLELPVDWSRHIEEAAQGNGQTCIGPVASLQGAKAKYDRAIAALRNPGETEFTLVCRPERTSVDELLRAREELRTLGIGNFRIVVNGVIPVGAGGPFASQSSFQREQVRRLSGKIDRPCIEVPLQSGEVKGLSALGRFAAIVFDGKTDTLHGEFAGTRPFTGFSSPHVLRKMVTGGPEAGRSFLPEREGSGKPSRRAPWRRASRGRGVVSFWRPPTRRPTSGRSFRRRSRARFVPFRATPGSSPSGSTRRRASKRTRRRSSPRPPRPATPTRCSPWSGRSWNPPARKRWRSSRSSPDWWSGTISTS